MFDAGVNLLVSPPSASPRLGVAYAVADRAEIGLRWAPRTLRLGGRWQLARRDRDGLDASVGLGVAYLGYAYPIVGEIPVLSLDRYTRWQVDVPLAVGRADRWYRVWGGPKLALTTFRTELALDAELNERELAAFRGRAALLGGHGGVALGWDKLFLAGELTVVGLVGAADTTVLDAAHRTPLRGFVVVPTGGLLGEF